MKIERFTGINNRQPIDRMKPDESGGMPVRDAVNVDLSSVGTFQRRPGMELALAGTNCRSLFDAGPIAYYADGAQLKSFNGTSSAVIASLASSYAKVAYTKSPRGLIWSDGFSNNMVSGGVSRRLATPAPNPEPVVAANGPGALRAGTYGVFFASVGSDGQQSAMTFPVYVAVPANGAIQITCLAYASRVAVFVTAQNGEIFYRETYIEPGQTTAVLPMVSSAGQPVKYEVHSELPPGDILAIHNGRLIVGDGAFVYYSLPYNYGIHRPAFDYIPMGDEVTLIAPVEGGVFIATTKETRFFAGGDIASAEPTTVLPYGAAKGTLSEVLESTDLMWFSARGPVRGASDGSVVALQDKQISFEPMAEGAAMYREQQGMRQFVAALTGKTGSSGAVFGSYMDAEVIKGN